MSHVVKSVIEVRASAVLAPESAALADTNVSPIHLGNDWPQLWFTALRHDWTSLVIVPADRGISSLTAARALAESGRLYRESQVHLFDLGGISPAAAGEFAQAVTDASAGGERAIIAVDCPLENHAAIRVARAADAALLLVPLGAAGINAARKTIDLIGRENFIGSITVTPNQRLKRR